MTAPEVLEVVGYLLSSWAVGYAGGYSLTAFRRAMDAVS